MWRETELEKYGVKEQNYIPFIIIDGVSQLNSYRVPFITRVHEPF